MPDLRRPERTYTIRQLCIEFKVTPRALRFYEDKGLLSPAREGLNRVYNYRDRARLTLILQGKRVGLSLSDIREILELYSPDDGNAAQSAKSLRKFRDQIVALEAKREDIEHALEALREGCAAMEARLAKTRPDLLSAEAEAGQAPRARLDAVHEFAK